MSSTSYSRAELRKRLEGLALDKHLVELGDDGGLHRACPIACLFPEEYNLTGELTMLEPALTNAIDHKRWEELTVGELLALMETFREGEAVPVDA